MINSESSLQSSPASQSLLSGESSLSGQEIISGKSSPPVQPPGELSGKPSDELSGEPFGEHSHDEILQQMTFEKCLKNSKENLVSPPPVSVETKVHSEVSEEKTTIVADVLSPPNNSESLIVPTPTQPVRAKPLWMQIVK